MRAYFRRPEPHQRALAYLQGLMSDAPRKNGWQVAEAIGEVTPYAVQHLLDRTKWDCDGARDELAAYVWETLATPNAVVVIDETGFLKKGDKSVGATKPELAQRMLHRLFQAGLPVAWVTGDTVYGSAPALRADLEARSQAYALAVPCKEYVDVQGTRKRADHVAREFAREEWQVLSAGAGSKGPRLFAWARVELAAPAANGWRRWLLVRRSLEEGVKPAEMAYILVFAPAGTSLVDIVEAFGTRWTVEQCLGEAKGEVGLDEYEVRTFHGWFRFITLSTVGNPSRSFAYHLAWSSFRRAHQALARLYHYKHRCTLTRYLQL